MTAIITLANGQKVTTTGEMVKTLKKPHSNKPAKGYILYEGASVLDGSPIVCIATMETSNEKTGNMVQTWIIRSDMSPTEASKSKLDSAVCGMCPHRTSLKGACYVTLHQAPLAVYKSYKKGNYKHLDKADLVHFANKRVRMGAYGDPAAVPFQVWSGIVASCAGHTGYTHQIAHKNFDSRIATLCQISADTEKQALQAQKKGFKTFRVKTENMKMLDSEMQCLNVSHGISCLDCGLCDGSKMNIVIDVHGSRASRFDKFERII